jgi:vitamin B12 transporter
MKLLSFSSLSFFPFLINPFASYGLEKLEPVKVYGEQNYKNSETHLNSQDIEKQGKIELQNLLRNVPGVTIFQGGGIGTTTTVRIRGAEPRHTKFIVDGIDIHDPSTYDGGAMIDHLLLSPSLSNLYIGRGLLGNQEGDNALGGVIELKTLIPQKGFTGNIRSLYGSYKTFQESLLLSYGSDFVDIVGDFMNFSSVGGQLLNARNHKMRKRNYHNLTGGGNITLKPSENLRVKFVQKNIHGNQNLNESLYPSSFKTDSAQILSRVETTFLSDDENLQVMMGYNHGHFKRLYFFRKRNKDFFQGESHKVEGKISYIFDRPHTLLKAGGIYNIDENRDRERQKKTKNKLYNQEAFVLGQLGLHEKLWLSSNARWIGGKPFQNYGLLKVGIDYILPDFPLHTFIRAGTDLQKPSLWQLHNPFFGNPNLKPEISKTFEAGFDLDFQILKPSLTLFTRKIKKFFDYDFKTFRYSNASQSSQKGSEFALDFIPQKNLKFSFFHAYTYVETRPRKKTYIPRHQGGGSLEFEPFPQLQFFTQVVVTDRRQFKDNETFKVPVLLSQVFTYKPLPFLALQLRGDNLLNTKYEESYGVKAPKRQGFIQATLRF